MIDSVTIDGRPVNPTGYSVAPVVLLEPEHFDGRSLSLRVFADDSNPETEVVLGDTLFEERYVPASDTP